MPCSYSSLLGFWPKSNITSTLCIGLFLLCTNAFAQPRNDNCTNAIVIQNPSDYCSSNGAYSNTAASQSRTPSPNCWNNCNNDVWFTFQANGSSVVITVIGNSTNRGSLSRPELALYSGTCNTLTLLGCDQAPNNNIASIELNNLRVGERYYIRVDGRNNGTGTFQLCINNYQINADLTAAIFLCTKDALQLERFYGGGNINEGQNSCIDGNSNSIESNSAWYIWKCGKAGSLTFDIVPLQEDDDIDWFILDLGSNKELNYSSNKLVRCAAGNGVSCSPSYFRTGMRTSANDLTELAGCVNGQDGYLKALDLTEGHYYALMVNNFSSNNGFNLEFGGTAQFDGPKAAFSISTDTTCLAIDISLTNRSSSANSYTWTFDSSASSVSSDAKGPLPIRYRTSGNKTIYLEVRDSSLNKLYPLIKSTTCLSKDSIRLFISDLSPQNDSTIDSTITIGDTIFVSLSNDSRYLYSWFPDSNKLCQSCANQALFPSQNTAYYVLITDQFECYRTQISYNLSVNNPPPTIDDRFSLAFPDAFSPDGDGVNDKIWPDGLGIEQVYFFKVLNTYGNVIHSASGNPGKEIAWDGKFKGKPQNTGVYVYSIAVKAKERSETIFKKGKFLLIRNKNQ